MPTPNFPPTPVDFKAYFNREFTYGAGGDMITDLDITRALNEAGLMFNPSLFDSTTLVGSATTEGGIAFMLLAAHNLVFRIQNMTGGLSARAAGKGPRSTPAGVPVASGVGPASVSFQVPPPRIADNAVLLHLFMTSFGQQYTALLEPRLIGNVAVVSGRSPWPFIGNTPANIDPGPPV